MDFHKYFPEEEIEKIIKEKSEQEIIKKIVDYIKKELPNKDFIYYTNIYKILLKCIDIDRIGPSFLSIKNKYPFSWITKELFKSLKYYALNELFIRHRLKNIIIRNLDDNNYYLYFCRCMSRELSNQIRKEGRHLGKKYHPKDEEHSNSLFEGIIKSYQNSNNLTIVNQFRLFIQFDIYGKYRKQYMRGRPDINLHSVYFVRYPGNHEEVEWKSVAKFFGDVSEEGLRKAFWRWLNEDKPDFEEFYNALND